MIHIRRTALAAASVAMCAAVTTGCGALHEAPISNARANKNISAIQDSNAYSGVSQQAEAQAKNAARDGAEEEAAKDAENAKKKAQVSNKRAKADPVGTRNDMEPVAQTSDIPAWVTAINWAQTKLGHKYVWGGESDAEGGFDCSGLMQAAYAQAGIKLPRVAQDQYRATRMHPKKSELRVGDLVFYGTSSNIHHVGLYVGSGMMLHAPNSRSKIRFDRIDYMKDYYGATRISR